MPNSPTDIRLPLEDIERLLMRIDVMNPASDTEAAAQLVQSIIDYRVADQCTAWLHDPAGCHCIASTVQSATAPEIESLDSREAFSIIHENELCIFATHPIADDCHLILDCRVNGHVSPSIRAQREEIVEGISEAASKVFLKARLATLTRQVSRAKLAELAIKLIGSNQSLTEVAERAAGSLCESIEADRVSILQTHAGGTKVLAVAPSETIDHRSTVVRNMETLVSGIAPTRTSFTFTASDSVDRNELPRGLAEFISSSPCEQLHVDVATDEDAKCRCSIVIESFTHHEEFDETAAEATLRVLPALQHVVAVRNRGLAGTARRLITSNARSKVTIAILMIACLLSALFWIPADFRLPVDGFLQPVARRHVFAPSAGIIGELHVAHGDQVERGDTLISMQDPELDRQLGQLEGELSTLQTQLNSVRALRSGLGRESRDASAQLTVREEDLKIQIDGVQRQLDLIRQHQSVLTVRSPLSGTIDRWDMQQVLAGRPVNMGQHLLDVIDSGAGWKLRLDIPDDLIEYIRSENDESACPVSFRVRSDPTRQYRTHLGRVANTTQLSDNGQLVVQAEASLDGIEINVPRGGASVVAHVYCGKRSLGFVWFREIIELWQRTDLF